jgi:uncharacterized protein
MVYATGVTLCDAGPLVALLDRDERRHADCVAFVRTLQGRLLTTWPAFTEAMYLLGRSKGWPAQDRLWQLVEDGALDVAAEPPTPRLRALMERYRDLPMALADATLVALAEQRQLREVFTLDTDFHVYRLEAGDVLHVVP